MRDFVTQIQQYGLESIGVFLGNYRGKVVSNDDPEKLGRLKVLCPTVLGTAESEWCWPKGVIAGANAGIWVIPNAGDNVWICFEAGKPSSPIWEYGWWSKGKAPKANDTKSYIIQTTNGNTIVLNDTKDEISINVQDISIKVDSQGVKVGNDIGVPYSVVLGEQLLTILTEVLTLLSTETVIGLPLTKATSYAAVIPKLQNILSKIVKTIE